MHSRKTNTSAPQDALLFVLAEKKISGGCATKLRVGVKRELKKGKEKKGGKASEVVERSRRQHSQVTNEKLANGNVSDTNVRLPSPLAYVYGFLFLPPSLEYFREISPLLAPTPQRPVAYPERKLLSAWCGDDGMFFTEPW